MASAQQPSSAAAAAAESPASSVTATDAPRAKAPAAAAPIEPAALPAETPKRWHVSHWNLITNPSGICPEVLEHQYPGAGTEENPYLVSFLDDDPHNPQTFPRWKKWVFTLTMAVATLAIAFVSTAYSGGLTEVISDFHISEELSIAGISLFVVGFAVGPLLWAPMSEFFGRQLLFIGTYIVLTAFNAGCAGSQNIQTLIILRFFAGSFGSSPLTNAGGVIADMFDARDRGIAAAVFAAAPFLGPSLGPIVAGFLGETEGWRWVEGLMAIFTGVMTIAGALIVPETYAPVLLRKRAAALSKKTGKLYASKLDVHHHHDNTFKYEKPNMGKQFRTALMRPWTLLFREPIVMITSLYMAIVYGTMYMMFPAFPIVFQLHRGWSAGIGGLAFLGITCGMVVAVTYALIDNIRYNKVAKKNGGAAPPEARLPVSVVGSILLPIGLFWFAWTDEAPVHWIVPIIGSGFFGAGLVMVFLSLMNYLIDSYVVFAASVLAANAVIRSLFGAAFPLFTTYMYENLGLHWAASIPAFLALACVPFPILFMKYGAQIRMRCKYANEAAAVLARMRAMHAPIDVEEALEEVEEHDEQVKLERSLTRQATRASRASRNSGVHKTFSFGRVFSHDSQAASGSGTNNARNATATHADNAEEKADEHSEHHTTTTDTEDDEKATVDTPQKKTGEDA